MRDTFRLVDAGWAAELDKALANRQSTVRIVCPFIKKSVVERLLKRGIPGVFQVITRFNLSDFSDGVSDISALRLLLDSGAQIRGIRNLHAKLYLFGDHVMVTSANLTEAALLRNHEFGFIAEDADIVDRCRRYFDGLWGRAGQNLPPARLAEWEAIIETYLASGARPSTAVGLGDEGVDAGIFGEPTVLPAWIGEAEQAFVKFFGHSANRADRSKTTFEEVQSSGCHWACTYPDGRRPRQVQTGAVMYMSRLVREPDDILVYGRAVGMRHEPGRDDATPEDIQERDWKTKWPHYIRVHHAEFVGGSLANGVSLNELMHVLKADAFASTHRHAGEGAGNTSPRRAYMRQPAVELSPLGHSWLIERLEHAFVQHGRLAPAMLEQLDWPTTIP